MANRRFTQFFNTLHKEPVLLDCNFTVDSSNAAGISGLKGAGIQAVYMDSTSPSSGNPDPGAGVILIQFQDTYNRYFGGSSQLVCDLSGSSLTSVTAKTTYVITVLGTTTLAQWQAKGLPVGITPAVGVAFVATATGAIGGTGAVQITAAAGSGVDHIEVIGDPNLTLKSSAATVVGISSGAYMLMQCFAAGVKAAPADGSKIYLQFYLSNSNILNQGE